MKESGYSFKGDIFPELNLINEGEDLYTAFRIYETPLEGLLVFQRKCYFDDRGTTQETFKYDPLSEVIKVPLDIKQTSFSDNNPRTLRGIHAEPIYKFVTPVLGTLFMAIVDLRPESATFGKHAAFTIAQRHFHPRKTIVIPSGFGNSFLTLGNDPVIYHYAINTQYVSSEGKRSVIWNDPYLNISWPEEPKHLSDADKNNPTLRQLFPEKFLLTAAKL